MAHNFTDEQAEAITTEDYNLVVAAGAGSGKTRVLVERFIYLLENHHDWKLNSLVAITFTRAAALEMRDRLRRELSDHLNANQEDDEKRQRWTDLLAQIDSARISTFDSLCATILRANATSAQIDPTFEVLDEVQKRLLIDDVFDDIIEQFRDINHPALALFSNYDENSIREVTHSLITNSAQIPNPIPQASEFITLWQSHIGDALFPQVELLTRYIHDEAHDPFDPDDALSQDLQTIINAYEILSDPSNLFDIWDALSQIASINLQKGKRSGIYKEPFEFRKFVCNEARDLLKKFPPITERDHKASEMMVLWLQWLNAVQQLFNQRKREANLMDFNDLSLATLNLLDNFPAVRERYNGINGEFNHILVDEFQDTNSIQWQIVSHLSPQRKGAYFIVGDAKQSIYAFRGGDVSVFNRVCSDLDHSPIGKILPLSQSFRSHQILIHLFNDLFSSLFQIDTDNPHIDYQIEITKKDIMSAHRQEIPVETPIEFLLLDATYGYQQLPEQEQRKRKSKKLSTDEVRQWEAVAIAERIKEIAQASVTTDDVIIQQRGYGSIALLFRATTSITLYEDALKAYNIPFVTFAGRGYFDRQEVWDILNLLRALHNPLDDLSLASVLRSPIFAFNDELLFKLRLSDENGHIIPLWESLSTIPTHINAYITSDDTKRITYAYTTLYELSQLSGRVKISELLRIALQRTSYLAILTSLPAGQRLRRNIEKLVNIAEASNLVLLEDFTRYLEDLTASEAREGEAILDAEGVVQLMTVHASKGLEFDTVFVVDASYSNTQGEKGNIIAETVNNQTQFACKVFDEQSGKHEQTAYYTYLKAQSNYRTQPETIRLLYVAMTRAENHLIISGSISQDKKGNYKSKGWLDTLVSQYQINPTSPDTIHGNGYHIHLHRPVYDPTIPQKIQTTQQISNAWNSIGSLPQNMHPEPHHLPLLQTPPSTPDSAFGHLVASNLASLGSYQNATDMLSRQFYRDKVRNSILDDSPAEVRQIRLHKQNPSARIIGDIVHEALRYWHFTDDDVDLDALFRTYAWKHRVFEQESLEKAIHEARKLLKRFQKSDVYDWVEKAREQNLPVYPELPFIYHTGKRIVHGVIDLLLQRPDGTWSLVDYKTSTIPNFTSEAAKVHAEQYHLQVGMYATATLAELGKASLNVHIHYIRYNHTVSIPTDVWQARIANLESDIGDITQDLSKSGSRYD